VVLSKGIRMRSKNMKRRAMKERKLEKTGRKNGKGKLEIVAEREIRKLKIETAQKTEGEKGKQNEQQKSKQ
jgi:hypothetical protein